MSGAAIPALTLNLPADNYPVTPQAIFGAPAQPTPLTSYRIPAGRFTSGRVYRAWLDYDTVAAINTTAVAVSAVGTLYSKELSFYISAQAPGAYTAQVSGVGRTTGEAIVEVYEVP